MLRYFHFDNVCIFRVFVINFGSDIMNQLINIDEYTDNDGYIDINIKYCINIINNLINYKAKLVEINENADIRNIDKYIENGYFVLDRLVKFPYSSQPKAFVTFAKLYNQKSLKEN